MWAFHDGTLNYACNSNGLRNSMGKGEGTSCFYVCVITAPNAGTCSSLWTKASAK